MGGVTSWVDGPCVVVEYGGCTYDRACNYDPNAAFDDGSCTFPPDGCYWPDTYALGCTYVEAINYDPEATIDDGSCTQDPCPVCLGDVNGDGYIGVSMAHPAQRVRDGLLKGEAGYLRGHGCARTESGTGGFPEGGQRRGRVVARCPQSG